KWRAEDQATSYLASALHALTLSPPPCPPLGHGCWAPGWVMISICKHLNRIINHLDYVFRSQAMWGMGLGYKGRGTKCSHKTGFPPH
ncbi:unnamed protein product, partial [Gulo gulo]